MLRLPVTLSITLPPLLIFQKLLTLLQVIITSYLFPNGKFSQSHLDAVLAALDDDKSKLVIDLSCRRQGEDKWFVAMNKWQTITDMEVCEGKFFPFSSPYFPLSSPFPFPFRFPPAVPCPPFPIFFSFQTSHSLPPIPLHTLLQRHPLTTKTIQRASNCQVNFAAT